MDLVGLDWNSLFILLIRLNCVSYLLFLHSTFLEILQDLPLKLRLELDIRTMVRLCIFYEYS